MGRMRRDLSVLIWQGLWRRVVSPALRPLGLSVLVLSMSGPAFGESDARQGARTARQCIVCHAFTAGVHMTGPSLSGVFGRKAGSVQDFDRYSDALINSGLVWDADTLDRYLENPQKTVSGTTMTALVAGAKDRSNVIAFLKAIQSEGQVEAEGIPIPRPNFLDLKTVGNASRVDSITLCRDTYRVKMQNGAHLVYWERNLRFKTDTSKIGPEKGKPVLLLGGMHGDRGSIIFSHPNEMSGFITNQCAEQ